jgi:hypothetical protein
MVNGPDQGLTFTNAEELFETLRVKWHDAPASSSWTFVGHFEEGHEHLLKFKAPLSMSTGNGCPDCTRHN